MLEGRLALGGATQQTDSKCLQLYALTLRFLLTERHKALLASIKDRVSQKYKNKQKLMCRQK